MINLSNIQNYWGKFLGKPRIKPGLPGEKLKRNLCAMPSPPASTDFLEKNNCVAPLVGTYIRTHD